jgi:predicted HAD superfamily Cof-like phosphohydrolase
MAETAPEPQGPDVFSDVAAFHEKFGVAGRAAPGFLLRSDTEHRLDFIEEEWRECWEALSDGDLPAFIDGHIDLIYVAVGTLVKMGLTPKQFAACWQEVQRANMAKVAIPGQWKIGKPEGWTPPDITGALGL